MRSAARISRSARDFRAAERALAEQRHLELAGLLAHAERTRPDWFVWLMARRDARPSSSSASSAPSPSAGRAHALLCRCGRWLYDHASTLENSAGGRSYGGCADAGCVKFRNAAGEGFIAGQLRPDSD